MISKTLALNELNELSFSILQANVSIGRVAKFLRSEDLKPDVVNRDPNAGKI